jgi:hypothetical protein
MLCCLVYYVVRTSQKERAYEVYEVLRSSTPYVLRCCGIEGWLKVELISEAKAGRKGRAAELF